MYIYGSNYLSTWGLHVHVCGHLHYMCRHLRRVYNEDTQVFGWSMRYFVGCKCMIYKDGTSSIHTDVTVPKTPA